MEETTGSLEYIAAIENNLSIDPPIVIQYVTEQLMASRPESSSYTLSFFKEKGVQPGEATTYEEINMGWKQ